MIRINYCWKLLKPQPLVFEECLNGSTLYWVEELQIDTQRVATCCTPASLALLFCLLHSLNTPFLLPRCIQLPLALFNPFFYYLF